ncbi:hypothetical protein F2Q69_00019790 [Brassica cretica]|uniref:beta-carotene 3-hydroxylase n=1 Tax=Brassica cretica TaxID=69181 RepID=A0A8S9QD63_BRACR|nr:hypothetical protein F2Q69_00019790 [Brassica cretica]
MAAGLSSLSVTHKPLNHSFSSSNSRLNHHRIYAAVFPPSRRFNGFQRRTVCFVLEEQKQSSPMDDKPESTNSPDILTTSRLLKKAERKKSERFTYLIAAMMSSFGVTSMAIMAGLGITMFGIAYMFVHDGLVHKRFPVGPIANVPYLRKVAAAHQEVEEVGGKEELEKEISRRIKLYNKGLVPGLCFGAGLGITMFGIAYMFVHDGLVHKRFPVGPIANVPYLRKVAAAHQLHHTDKFKGVPYGLFLGPKASLGFENGAGSGRSGRKRRIGERD